MRRAALAACILAVAAGAAARAPEPRQRARVIRVFDGDTLEVRLDGKPRRVRLIGVDTPEVRDNEKLARDVRKTGRTRDALMALGRTAAEFTRKAALDRDVELELDVERQDRYRRLLAYVWLPDGRMLNAELLKEGHAVLMTVPPNVRHVSLFRRLQSEAREGRRGLWAEPSSRSRAGTPRGGRARDSPVPARRISDLRTQIGPGRQPPSGAETQTTFSGCPTSRSP